MATTEERGDRVDIDLTRPVDAEGDDITVIATPADTPAPGSRRRLVWALAAAAVVVLVIAGVAYAIAGDDDAPTVTTTQDSPADAVVDTPVEEAPAEDAPAVDLPKADDAPKASVAPKEGSASAQPKPVKDVPAVPPTNTPLPPPEPPDAPVVNEPKASPVSVLVWTAPKNVTLAAGTTKTVDVSARNPSDGVVTLPVPLTCGGVLPDGGMCAQIVQTINPGGRASAPFVIDATAVGAGTYTVKIAGVQPITVTVTD